MCLCCLGGELAFLFKSELVFLFLKHFQFPLQFLSSICVRSFSWGNCKEELPSHRGGGGGELMVSSSAAAFYLPEKKVPSKLSSSGVCC